MKTPLLVALVFAPSAALAHVGVVNTQSQLALAGRSYELLLSVPHGCEANDAHLDTTRIEVSIPTKADGTALVTGVRPLMDGVFGKVEVTRRDAAGNALELKWTKPATLELADDSHLYRIGLRGMLPTTPFVSLRFTTRQVCRSATGEVVKDWGLESPKVKVFPSRQPGWNRIAIAPELERHGKADVTAFLRDFFSDAQVVWLGKRAWSANEETMKRLDEAQARELGLSKVADAEELMLHAGDELWAKY